MFKSKIVLFGFLIATLIITLYIVQFTTHLQNKAAAPLTSTTLSTANIIQSIKDETTFLLNTPNTSSEDKLSHAINRQKLMLSLIEVSPEDFLSLAIPQKITSKFNPELQGVVEKEVQISGRLEHRRLDNFETKQSWSEFYLYTPDNQKLRLYFVTPQANNLPSDININITGYQLDNTIVVSSFSLPKTTTTQKLSSTTIGAESFPQDQTVAVVLFNFNDKQEQPWTVENINEWTFTGPDSMASYYSETSFGKLNFTGDVYGWITVSVNVGTGSCPAINASNEAKQQLLSTGVNLDNYDHIIYAFPKISCGYSGLNMGGKESWINGSYDYQEGLNNTHASTVIHELGHSLGLKHANSYSCHDNNNLRVASDFPFNCTSDSYGDLFDVMGSAYYSRHLNAFHKGQLNSFSPANLLEVSNSGTYTIFPVNSNLPTNIQSIRIPAGTDYETGEPLFYYLEYRQPFGIFDNFNYSDPVVNGISIRLGPDYSNYSYESKLIDTTPETSHYQDAALGLNQIFDDTKRGVRIETTAINTTSATVNITTYTPPCVREKPIVKIPITQYGTPVQEITYPISVSNTDSLSCSASTFTITPTLPNGWTQDPPILTSLISPGTKVNLNFKVRSSPDSPLGFTTFTQTTDHNNDPQLSVDTTGNYYVYIDSTPTINFISPTNGQTLPPGTINIQVGVSDPNSISNVSLYDNNQFAGSMTTSGSGIYTKSHNLSLGTHTLKVEVYNSAGNSSEPSITVNVVPAPTPTLIPTPTFTPTPTPTPKPSVLSFFAAGSASNSIYPTVELRLNGTTLKRWANIRGNPNTRVFTKYNYTFSRKLKKPDIVRLVYINDDKKSGTIGRNLRIDKIVVDGITYQSESGTTYSTGTWSSGANKCTARYAKSEWLHCNGYFQYKIL